MCEPIEDLEKDCEAAIQRLANHLQLEDGRIARGEETDLERYLNGREIRD